MRRIGTYTEVAGGGGEGEGIDSFPSTFLQLLFFLKCVITLTRFQKSDSTS